MHYLAVGYPKRLTHALNDVAEKNSAQADAGRAASLTKAMSRQLAANPPESRGALTEVGSTVWLRNKNLQG